MNHKPIIILIIIFLICIIYISLKSDKLYEVKWNVPDTTLAITIDGEISTTFPTTSAYTGIVECSSGTGKVEWNGSKWILSANGITKGSTTCNITFTTKIPTFADIILTNNNVVTPLTIPGQAISTSEEALLASAKDDYGTSYYFRGSVINNYVQFANKCWRIVRITGDGSVKLVLHNDNTSSVSNPCSSSNNSDTAAFAKYSGTTYTSAFNKLMDDNAYIGFMYGASGSSDYVSTHANTNKSTILTNLETWYKNNLKSYEGYLADIIWCNDKSITSGLGYLTDPTNYGAYNRIRLTTQPSLICPNDNNGGKLSKFTVSDTINGNGNLTYKIGLLTADEMTFAGLVYGPGNTTYYLYENTGGKYWWTLTPYVYAAYAEGWDVASGSFQGGFVLNARGLRPSIALISSTTVTGSGTSEEPYIVN